MSTKDSGRGYKYTDSICNILFVEVWVFSGCCYKKHYQSKLKVEQEMKEAFSDMKSVFQEGSDAIASHSGSDKDTKGEEENPSVRKRKPRKAD
jgi:hypothetical protein